MLRKRPPRPVHLRPPLGRRLAELRLAKGFTTADVAAELHVARTFVTRVEVGERSLPPARRAAWAALLGASVAELEALR